LRFGLAAEPNIVTLAAARTDLAPPLVLDHCQRLPGGLDVLASSPRGKAVVRAALTEMDTGRLVAALDKPAGVDVVADIGRIDPDSPVVPATVAATVTLLVARPNKAEITHLHRALPAVIEASRRVLVLLIGDTPYPAAEVADALRVEARALPVDTRAAATLSGDRRWPGRLERLPLLRAARSLVAELTAETHGITLPALRVAVPDIAEGTP